MAEILLDFLNKPTIKQPMLIGRGILPVAGKMIIGGIPKSNKSYVVLNMAMALVKGKPLFDAYYPLKPPVPVMDVFKPCKVLYIEQEIGEDGLKERLLGILGGELATYNLFIKTRDMEMRLDTKEGVAAIDKEISEVQPDVVIFDPLAKFHLSDENSAREMGAIMRIGDCFIERYKCALIYVHHIGKESTENPRHGGNRLRGSSALFADVDTMMEVNRLSSPSATAPLLELKFELRRGKPLNPMKIRREVNGVCSWVCEDFAGGEGTKPDEAAPAEHLKKLKPYDIHKPVGNKYDSSMYSSK